MLKSGKIFRALRDKKNKYSNSRVVRKKNSERNKKNIFLSVFEFNFRESTSTTLYIIVIY
jgi:hypothetical protein